MKTYKRIPRNRKKKKKKGSTNARITIEAFTFRGLTLKMGLADADYKPALPASSSFFAVSPSVVYATSSTTSHSTGGAL